MSRWMAEQNKDVHRLCKHIEQMEATINPLKAEVTAFEKETKQAESKARRCEKELQLERETQSAVKKQFEVRRMVMMMMMMMMMTMVVVVGEGTVAGARDSLLSRNSLR